MSCTVIPFGKIYVTWYKTMGWANVTWCIKNHTWWLQYVSEQWIVISDTCSAINRTLCKSLVRGLYSLLTWIELLLSKTCSCPTSLLCGLWPFELYVEYTQTMRTLRVMKATAGDIYFIGIFLPKIPWLYLSLPSVKRHTHGAL